MSMSEVIQFLPRRGIPLPWNFNRLTYSPVKIRTAPRSCCIPKGSPRKRQPVIIEKTGGRLL
jgi:hypothetical protein